MQTLRENYSERMKKNSIATVLKYSYWYNNELIKFHHSVYSRLKLGIDNKLWSLEKRMTLNHVGGVLVIARFNYLLLLSGGEDSTVKLWSLRTRQCSVNFQGHSEKVTALLKFNETMFLSGSGDTSIRIWSIFKGSSIDTLSGHLDTITCLLLFQESYVISGSKDGFIKFWNVSKIQCLYTLKSESVISLAKLGNYLVNFSVGNRLSAYYLRNLESKSEISYESESSFSAIIFTRLNAKIIVAGFKNGSIKLFETETKKGPKGCPRLYEKMVLLDGHDDAVTTMLKIDEKRLVSGGIEGSLVLWDLEKQTRLVKCKYNSSPIFSLIKLSSQKIAFGCKLGVTLCDLGNQYDNYNDKLLLNSGFATEFTTLNQGHTAIIKCLLVFDLERVFSSSEDGTILCSSLRYGFPLFTLKGHSDSVNCIIKLRHDLLASASSDGTIKVWNTNKGICENTLYGHTGIVFWLAKLSLNYIASCGADNLIRLWDVSLNKCLVVSIGYTGPIFSICKFTEGVLLSGGWDKEVKMWNYSKTFTCLTCLNSKTGHEGPINTISKLNSLEFITGSWDKSVKIWNILDLTCVKTFTEHTGSVYCLVRLNSLEFASGSYDNSVKTWNKNQTESLSTFTLNTSPINSIVALNYKQLVCASWDGSVNVFNYK